MLPLWSIFSKAIAQVIVAGYSNRRCQKKHRPAGLDETDVTRVVDRALEQIREVVSNATRTWRKCFSRVLVTLGNDDVAPPLAVQASSQIAESRRLEPERRQAANGNWYTREEFEAYYRDSIAWHTAPQRHAQRQRHTGNNSHES